MKNTILIISLFLYCNLFAQSQDNQKLGVKTSFNLSSMIGSSVENSRIKFGYTAGIYYSTSRQKKVNLYTEILGNFKGGNFKNGNTGYSKIALFYIDASILPNLSLANNRSISIGPSFSYLGLSSVYVGDKKKPEDQTLDLSPFDMGLASFYTISQKIVSYQFGVKIGLMNINNIAQNNLMPVINPSGTIRNFSVEIGMLF